MRNKYNSITVNNYQTGHLCSLTQKIADTIVIPYAAPDAQSEISGGKAFGKEIFTQPILQTMKICPKQQGPN